MWLISGFAAPKVYLHDPSLLSDFQYVISGFHITSHLSILQIPMVKGTSVARHLISPSWVEDYEIVQYNNLTKHHQHE